MAKEKRTSIKVKILVPIILLLLFGNVISYIAIRDSLKKSENDSISMDFTHVVSAVSAAISDANERERVILETIANIPQIKSRDVSLYDKSQLLYDYFIHTRGKYIDMCILDLDGNAYVAGTTNLMSFAERTYYQVPLKGLFYIENPYINKVTHEMAVFYGLPVFDDNNQVINVIFSVVKGYNYCELMSGFTVGKDSHPMIFDNRTGIIVGAADNAVLDSYVKLQDMDGLGTVADQIFSGNTDIARFHYSDKPGEYLVAYAPVEGTTWTVVAPAPLSDFNAGFTRLRHMLLVVYVLVVVITIILSFILLTKTLRPLKNVKKSITNIAEGDADLTQRLVVQTHDEIGNVVVGFNQFVEMLSKIVVSVKKSKEELSDSGNSLEGITEKTTAAILDIHNQLENVERQLQSQIDSVTHTINSVSSVSSEISNLDSLMEQQVSGVKEATGSVKDMISNITNVGSKIEDMSKHFEGLLTDTRNGSRMQEDMNRLIKDIEMQSETLGAANVVIADIAEQTNLLAMNAAIEAAHAGEAGKGFSVVADEIRKLSETSTVQSKTIGEQLSSIQNSIEEVVKFSEENMKVLNAVSDSIEKTNVSVMEIKGSIENEEQNSTQIERSLEMLINTTKNVYKTSEKMQQENGNIQQGIKLLEDSTSGMKSGFALMEDKVESVKEDSASLKTISSSIKDDIVKIGQQIDLFKV